MVNLLNFDRAGLENFFQEIGEKPFRARQVLKWIHQYGVSDFALMNNLSKNLRQRLSETACIEVPKVILNKPSVDGTHKWLLQMAGKNAIETVFIPEGNRGTLCISSQVGCTLTCTFCSTGTQGFNRNLSTAEIIGQLWIAVRSLSQQNGMHDRKVTNIVMMGMGEPLMNIDAVVPAMNLMLDDDAYGLSKRRVTLSTSGVVPQIYELMERTQVSLAVSLHAPNDELRNQLVPINRKYPLAQLIKACQDYLGHNPHKHITFEYVMLDQINDHLEHADQLIELVKDLPCKFNLIPFNTFPGTDYKCSSNNRIHAFQKRLTSAQIMTTIRKTRGDDIDAACGQLVGQVNDKTKRQQKHQQKIQTLNNNRK